MTCRDCTAQTEDNRVYPLITIGVSAYNRKDYLKLCLNSLLEQTYPNCQIIVVDDGSTDGTGAMMQAEYPQIKYIYQNNAGDAAAKNHAAQAADGEYIVFNDSDDLFMPDTVMRLYNALPADDSCACSYGTYQTIDCNGQWLPTRKKVKHYPSGMILETLLEHIIVNSCGTLMPRKLFLEAGGFDSSLRQVHDYKLFLNLAMQVNFTALQEPVFLRRRHADNLSSGSYAKQKVVLTVFDQFVQANAGRLEKFAGCIRRRYSTLHNKLYREARKEKLFAEARLHARQAFACRPGVKTFCRLLASCLAR